MPGDILLTGGTGVVGSWLRACAPADRPLVVAAWSRAGDGDLRVDLRDERATLGAIRLLEPELIVHAAISGERDMQVGAAQNLARAAAATGAGLVHLSTDALHAGDPGPISDQADPSPVSEYGRRKAEAEALVCEALPTAAIVRLPLVVSGDPPDTTVRPLLESPGESRWFVDELRRPARVDELAPAIWRIAQLSEAERAGRWQLAGPELISRLELAQHVADWLGLDPASLVAADAPDDGTRPKVLDVRDERARAQVTWEPSPIDGHLPVLPG